MPYLVNTKEHHLLKCKQIFSEYKIESFKGVIGISNTYYRHTYDASVYRVRNSHLGEEKDK